MQHWDLNQTQDHLHQKASHDVQRSSVGAQEAEQCDAIRIAGGCRLLVHEVPTPVFVPYIRETWLTGAHISAAGTRALGVELCARKCEAVDLGRVVPV